MNETTLTNTMYGSKDSKSRKTIKLNNGFKSEDNFIDFLLFSIKILKHEHLG